MQKGMLKIDERKTVNKKCASDEKNILPFKNTE